MKRNPVFSPPLRSPPPPNKLIERLLPMAVLLFAGAVSCHDAGGDNETPDAASDSDISTDRDNSQQDVVNQDRANSPDVEPPNCTHFMAPAEQEPSDSNDGRSLSTAWTTLEKAANTLTAGDTLCIADGTYPNQPSATMARSGSPDAPITIRARSGTPRFIDTTTTGSVRFLTISGQSYINLIGPFIIEGAYNSGAGYSAGVYITGGPGSHDITIRNLQLKDVGNPIAARKQAYNLLIENNDIGNAGWNSIGVYGTEPGDCTTFNGIHDVVIRNNNIHDFFVHNGIDLWANDENILIENNTISNTDQIAIYVHNGCGTWPNNNVTIRNNIIDSSGIRVIIASNLTLDGNLLSNIKGKGIEFSPGDEDDLQVSDITLDTIVFKNNVVKTSSNYAYSVDNNFTSNNIVVGNVTWINNSWDIATTPSNYGSRLVDAIAATVIDTNLDQLDTVFRYDGLDNAKIAYSNGRVFKISTSSDGSFLATVAQPDGMNVVAVPSGTRFVRVYDLFVIPTVANVSVVELPIYDKANDTYGISLSSSTAENPTWIDVTVNNAAKVYAIQRDGAPYGTIEAGQDKVVRFLYNDPGDDWSIPHTFSIQ